MDLLPDNLFTNLSVCQTVGRAFNVFLHSPTVFLGISASAVLPLALVLSLVAVHVASGTMGGDNADTANDDANVWIQDHFMLVTSMAVLYSFVTIISQAAVVRATALIYAGKSPSFSHCMAQGLRNCCKLFAYLASLFLGAVVIGFVFGIIAAILMMMFAQNDSTLASIILMAVVIIAEVLAIYFLILSFVSVVPIIVLENKSVIDSMERSWELASGNRCYIFASLCLLGVVNFIFGTIVPSMIMGGGATPTQLPSTIPGIIAFLLPQLVTIPVGGILATAIYFRLRVGKNGLNRQVLSQEMGFGENSSGELNGAALRYKLVGGAEEVAMENKASTIPAIEIV